jgi:hypothetical protein
MRIGTKSVLFGAHQFLIHPCFVAWAWWKLYGWSVVEHWSSVRGLDPGERSPLTKPVRTSLRDWRLWLAFFVHDLGYLGKPNMDGPEGERHPELGARILFRATGLTPWSHFVLYHSRFYAKQHGAPVSPLCIADKLATPLMPAWLYLPLARATGEIREYMAKSAHMNETGGKYAGFNLSLDDERQWHADMCAYMRRWVEEHRDGCADTWTPDTRVARTASEAWQ